MSHQHPLENLVELVQSYYSQDDDQYLMHQKMLAGAVRALDPYSCYLPPDQYRIVKNMAQGHLCGIGVELYPIGDKVVVQTVISDSPADRAGIHPGDVITHIDGQAIEPFTSQDLIMAKIAGPHNTKVIIGVNGQHIPMKRQDYLKIPTLLVKHQKNRLYVRICYFAQNTADELRQIIGIHPNASEIVLDLRNNPGGSLKSAVETVGIFIDTAPVVHVKSHMTVYNKTHICQGRAVCPHTPLLVIINKNTASAAEIVAAALQDHKRATLTGEQSLGKGLVQDFFDLPRYGGVKLTVGSFFSPNGHPIHNCGVNPDAVSVR